MSGKNNLYSDAFYKYQQPASTASAVKIIPLVKEYVDFTSVIDIGCGVGSWLNVCNGLLQGEERKILGVDGEYVNLELLEIPKDCFYPWDISTPIEGISSFFDLTISVEVAEHIDVDKMNIYMNNITSFSDVVLFSAAIPWQGGVHHVNEQWPSYWVDKFLQRNYLPLDCLRDKIWADEDICEHYRQNIMFFVKESSLNKYLNLQKERSMGKSIVLDIVHPAYYLRLTDRDSFNWTWKQFVKFAKLLVPNFLRALKRRFVLLSMKLSNKKDKNTA